MNPYNADTDYELFVAWEEGHLAALEDVLKVAKAMAHAPRGAVKAAVRAVTRKADKETPRSRQGDHMTTFTYQGQLNPDLAKHSGQECKIVRELDETWRSHEVGPMYHVRFSDGYEAHAFTWELDPQPESKTLRWVSSSQRWEAA